MSDRGLIDDALAVGAGFDWVTPVASMVTTLLTDRETFTTPSEYMNDVDGAARAVGVRLRNRTLSPAGDLYLFDCKPNEWERIAARLGW